MPSVYLDYKLDDSEHIVLWCAKVRCRNILYRSLFCKSIYLAIQNLIYIIKRDFSVTWERVRLNKNKSYVIYKYYEKERIIDKKKVVFQLTAESKNFQIKNFIIECKDFNKKFKYKPVSEYDLFKNLEEKEKLYLQKNFNTNICSKRKSWIKVYLEIQLSELYASDEFSEQLVDIGPEEEEYIFGMDTNTNIFNNDQAW